jgi:two-component system cell cycle sensor histidine kinase PleC
VEEGLPLLNADHRATVQMLLNLLSNAIKFTPPSGTIAIAARLVADGGVCISVRDSGIGIAKEDIPKALAVYSQVRNSHVREHKGTGLGLPIVNAMMELHGGMLQLESEPGQGTCVSLLFPPERSLRDDGRLAA